MYECMHVCTYVYMCVYNIQYSLAECNGVNYALVIGTYVYLDDFVVKVFTFANPSYCRIYCYTQVLSMHSVLVSLDLGVF